MRCLFCDEIDEKISFKTLFLKSDKLCHKCRNLLNLKRKVIKVEDFEVETFYEYDGIFKSLLLQYKECLDEALSEVFLYDLSDYINFKYFSYKICFVPSSKKKLEKRGFNHLKEMFKSVKLEELEGLMMKEDLCQEGLNLTERRKMANNFVYRGQHVDKVLVVDDVLTTGSTLSGVYRAIYPKVKTIKVLSLAYKK